MSVTRKTVTVLFCDITDSTPLGERLDPEALRDVMARDFQEMSSVVERHGGVVEKFIGDAVMAVFGIPVLHEDDALRAVRAAIEGECWSDTIRSYVMTAGGSGPDASLLLMGEYGYADGPRRERFARTVKTIEERLADGPLVRRYLGDDGLEGQEGAFGITSFWLVGALVFLGEADRARRHFEALLELANDVGLYGEEFDPSGAPLGNFPQAFTHVGLIHAALALEGAGREPAR
jgi:hypothetical protein